MRFEETQIKHKGRYAIMNENQKKQVPLRLSPKLYNAIAAWAEDDFRSVNGQIEYLLSECVRQRKKNGKYVSDEIDVPPELDIEWRSFPFRHDWGIFLFLPIKNIDIFPWLGYNENIGIPRYNVEISKRS